MVAYSCYLNTCYPNMLAVGKHGRNNAYQEQNLRHVIITSPGLTRFTNLENAILSNPRTPCKLTSKYRKWLEPVLEMLIVEDLVHPVSVEMIKELPNGTYFCRGGLFGLCGLQTNCNGTAPDESCRTCDEMCQILHKTCRNKKLASILVAHWISYEAIANRIVITSAVSLVCPPKEEIEQDEDVVYYDRNGKHNTGAKKIIPKYFQKVCLVGKPHRRIWCCFLHP